MNFIFLIRIDLAFFFTKKMSFSPLHLRNQWKKL